MKQLLLFALLSISLNCFADSQETQMMGMDPAKLQQMQAMVKKMQDCMKKIDRSAMEKLKERGQAMEKKIDALCRAGKRNEAQQQAIAFGKEVQNSPEVIQMNKCTAQMRSVMPTSIANSRFSIDKLKNKNVCDSNTSE